MGRLDLEHDVIDGLRASAGLLSTRGAFGDPQRIGEVTLVPVARIVGGVSGGGGDGGGSHQERWAGFGSMLGLGVHPVGVYEIRGDHVRWRPSVDVDRLLRRGQALAGVVIVCATTALVSRRRWRRR